MRVLLDNCVNRRFGRHISGGEVTHVQELNWGGLSNGKLLRAAEYAGFDVLLTVDKSVRMQQNLAGRRLTLITRDAPTILLEDLTQFIGQLEITLGAMAASGERGADVVLALPTEDEKDRR